MTQNTRSARRWDGLGERIPEYDFLVVNEREVRAAAGILFAIGFSGYITAIVSGDFRLSQAFAVFFLFDMGIRLALSPKYSPTMAIGRLVVWRQRPEWVSTKPKQFAWGLGFALAIGTCLAFGRLNAPLEIVLGLCGLCLSLLFAETAFGICVGCWIHKIVTRTDPEVCPGDSCTYEPPRRA